MFAKKIISRTEPLVHDIGVELKAAAKDNVSKYILGYAMKNVNASLKFLTDILGQANAAGEGSATTIGSSPKEFETLAKNVEADHKLFAQFVTQARKQRR